MFKKLAYAGAFVGAVAAVTAIGCGGGGTTSRTFDFAGQTSTDMAGETNPDAHAVSYFATNPHDVDVAQIGDPNGLNTLETPVSMSGLIVLASPTGFSSKITVTGDGCRYEVWAQDPTCTTPPCGILLETQAVLNPNGTGMFCPYADELDASLNVSLAATKQGDVISIQGVIDNFPKTGSAGDGGTSATVTSHEIELDTVTTTMEKGSLPAATVVTDTSPSMFVPYTGAGWAKYEGMYIKLEPPSGTAAFISELNISSSFTDTCTGVTGKTNGSFQLAATAALDQSNQGAYFADTYAGFYIEKEAGELTNCWPTDGLTFTSVSGIVSASFGGSILPAAESDFQH